MTEDYIRNNQKLSSLHILVLGPVALADLEECLDEESHKLSQVFDTYHRAVPVSDLVKQLLLAGARVSLLTNSQQVQSGNEISLKGNNLEVVVLPERRSVKMRAGTFWVAEILNLRKHILETNYDLIHAHWTYEYALAAVMTDRSRTVVTAHDAPWIILRHTFDAYHFAKLVLSLSVGILAHHIIFVSEYLRKSWGSLARGKKSVVSNFIQLPDVRNSTSDINTISDVIVCSIGDISNHKNLLCSLLAWNIFNKEISGGKYLVIGVTREQATSKWSNHAEVFRDPSIIWLGKLNRKQVAENLGSANVLLHSSLEESYCMAAAEALSLGIPVIGSANCTALVTLAGEAGMFVENLNPKSLSECLINYFTVNEVQTRLMAAAAIKAESMLQVNELSIGLIANVYAELI